MVRNLTFRLSTACAALVFTTTAALTGIEAHPLSVHGSHSEGTIALASDGPMHHPDGDAPGRYEGHSQHGSSEECTCVGPCQGGVSPNLPDPSSAILAVDETDRIPGISIVVFSVHEELRSYLFPLPNAPPWRV